MNKKYIHSWLDLAIEDLEVSTILFEKKLYSNSFYHFQQASEKALKAYCFLENIYDNQKDAYRTGHHTLKVFKDSLLKRQENLSELKQYGLENIYGKKLFIDYSKDLDKAVVAIPAQKDIFEYSRKMLDDMLQILSDLKDFNFTFPANFENQLIKETNLLWERISHLNKEWVKEIQCEFLKMTNNKNEFQVYIDDIKSYYSLIIKSHYYTTVLYYCNLISHNHNNLSRYPESDFNPLKYYNLNRPLIKKLPDFNSNLKSTLKQLKNWNEEFSPA